MSYKITICVLYRKMSLRVMSLKPIQVNFKDISIRRLVIIHYKGFQFYIFASLINSYGNK